MDRRMRKRGKRILSVLCCAAVLLGSLHIPAASVKAAEEQTLPEPVIHRQKLDLTGNTGADTSPELTQEELDRIKGAEDLTVVATFCQTAIGIGTLFSISDKSEGATHFHVYVNGNIVGAEFRNNKVTPAINESVTFGTTRKTIERGGVETGKFSTLAFRVENGVSYSAYVNGRKAVERTEGISFSGPSDYAAGLLDAGNIGSLNRSGGGYPFMGYIYDIAVYDTALTDAQIKQASAYLKAGVNDGALYHNEDAIGAACYRIPSLITTDKGTLVSAVDARFEGNSPNGGINDSPGNFDTAVRRKEHADRTAAPLEGWENGQVQAAFHLEDYPDAAGVQYNSSSFIDPVLVQDQIGQGVGEVEYRGKKNRIFLAADLFAWNGGLQNNGLGPAEGDGFALIDGSYYLLLTDANTKQGTKNNNKDRTKFQYAADINGEKNAKGRYDVYSLQGTPKAYTSSLEGHAVDDSNLSLGEKTVYELGENLELYKNGTVMPYTQEVTGKTVDAKVLYEDAELQMYNTSYLYMAYSDDDGKTFSSPKIISAGQKPDASKAYILGPGRGLQITAGNYKGRMLIPVYYTVSGTNTQYTQVLYSDDGGETWNHGGTVPSGVSLSEASAVELPDGSVRIYLRSAGNSNDSIYHATSGDGGITWSQAERVPDFEGTRNNTQMSVFNYSSPVASQEDQKEYPAVVLSHPAPLQSQDVRSHGELSVGLVKENPDYQKGSNLNQKYIIDFEYRYPVTEGQYAYSCATELPGGKIGLLYETTYDSSKVTYLERTMEQLTGTSENPENVSLKLDPSAVTDGSQVHVVLSSEDGSPIWSMEEDQKLEIRYRTSQTEGIQKGKMSLSAVEDNLTGMSFSFFAPGQEEITEWAVCPTEEDKLAANSGALLTKENVKALTSKNWSDDAGWEVIQGVTTEKGEDDTSKDITISQATSPDENSKEESAKKVLDNNSGTLWHTSWTGKSRENHYIVLDLGSVHKVDGLRYLPRQSAQNGMITKYRITFSKDGIHYGNTCVEGSWADSRNWKCVSFPEVETRYVKLTSLDSVSNDANTYTSAAEIRVTGDNSQEKELEMLLINDSDMEGEINKFAYFGEGWGFGDTPDSYDGMGDEHYNDINAGEADASGKYYTIEFYGSKIEVFGHKANNHGLVTYSVDGDREQTVSSYSAGRTGNQLLYKAEGLDEGRHVLKAAATGQKDSASGLGKAVIQVDYAKVYHKPYEVEDIVPEKMAYTLAKGNTAEIAYTILPVAAAGAPVEFQTDNSLVAQVNEKGVVTARAAGTAGITITAKGTDISKTIQVTVTKPDGSQPSDTIFHYENLNLSKEGKGRLITDGGAGLKGLSSATLDFLVKRTADTDQPMNLLTLKDKEGTGEAVIYAEGSRIGLETRKDRTTVWSQSEETGVFSDAEKWYHITVVFENNQAKIYLDGKFVCNLDCAPYLEALADPQDLVIGGATGELQEERLFKGYLSRAALYPAAMTAKQVAARFQDSAGVLEETVERPLPDASEVFRSEMDTPMFVGIKAEAAPGETNANNQVRLWSKEFEGDPEIMGDDLLGCRIPGIQRSVTPDPDDEDVLIAAADIGNNGADWGNLEPGIRKSYDSGKTWTKVERIVDLACNQADQKFDDKTGAFLIDPMLLEAPNGDLLMFIDMFPEYGVHRNLESGTGYKEIDGKYYRQLFTGALGNKDAGEEFTIREGGWVWKEGNNTRTNYYVPEYHSAELEYSTMGDMYYAVGEQDYFDKDHTPEKNPAPPTDIEGSNDIYVGNIFISKDKQAYKDTMTKSDFIQKKLAGPGGEEAGYPGGESEYVDLTTDPAPLRARITMYVWMIRSQDNGETWEQPVDLTPVLKIPEDGPYLGVGPGTAPVLKYQPIQSKNGRIVLPLYRGEFNEGSGAVTTQSYTEEGVMAYSDDGGLTWKRATSNYKTNYMPNKGEIQMIELLNGTIISFGRPQTSVFPSFSKTPISYSYDGGETWGDLQYDSLRSVKCQKAFISYPVDSEDPSADEMEDPAFDYPKGMQKGKQYIIASCPYGKYNRFSNGGRNWGVINLGEVQEDNSIKWIASRTLVLENNPYASAGANTEYFFAYSSLTVQADGTIGVHFEPQPNNYTAYASFNLAWILNGEQEGTVEKMMDRVVDLKKVTPKVLNFTSYYSEAEETVYVQAEYDEPVFVIGTPSVNMTADGKNYEAVYQEGSGTRQILFTRKMEKPRQEIQIEEVIYRNETDAVEGVGSKAVETKNKEDNPPLPEYSKVTLYANGGTLSDTEIQVETGKAFGRLPAPVRDGYTFEGWYAPNGSRITATDVCTGDILLTARWKKNTEDTEPDTEPDTQPDTQPDTKPDKPAEPASIKLNVASRKMGVKEKLQLKAAVRPANAKTGKLHWISSNKKVAVVDKKGKVTAKKPGKAVIKVTTENGKKTTCRITVKKAPKWVKLTASKKTLKVKKALRLKTTLPKKSAGSVTYKSSNRKVAIVDAKGRIKALKKGKVTITVKTYNGKKAKITLRIKK